MNKVAIFGYGTVGSGVYDYLKDDKETNVKYIFDREDKREELKDRLNTDYRSIIKDKEIDTIFECLGKDTLSYIVIKEALEQGKNVITSNKETVSNHLKEYSDLAHNHHCSFQFEAAVGGEVLLLYPLMIESSFESIVEIKGILNGTTNYIITCMEKQGVSFEEALRQSQEKGFAEKDPSDDILGYDLIRKSSILLSVLSRKEVDQRQVVCFPMNRITKEILEDIQKENLTLKYITDIRHKNDTSSVLISLAALEKEDPLSRIEYENNAILIENNRSADILTSSKGAGKYPTADSMLQDYQRVKKHIEYPLRIEGKENLSNNISGTFFAYKGNKRTILIDPSSETLKDYDVVIHVIRGNAK